MKTSHSNDALRTIDEMLKQAGIVEFRFCKENDCYVCDREGRFFSVCKRQYSKAGNLIENYRIVQLKGSVDKYGYVTYRIAVDGIKKHLKGHRMMLNAWVGENQEMVVNHIDGNKKNNALSNLEWCTVSENNAHAIENGLYDPHAAKHEYKVPVFDWMSIYIQHKHFGISLSELARINNCCHTTIGKIIERIDHIMPGEVRNGA